jgi:hypothetical protein
MPRCARVSFFLVPYKLLELFLILVVVFPLGEIRNVVFADLAGRILPPVGVKAFPFMD